MTRDGSGGSSGPAGPYLLDVDPDGLDAAGQGLQILAEHLAGRAHQVSTTPGEVTAAGWRGAAATAVCTEMTGLAATTTRFAGHFHAGAATLARLAADARDAQTQLAGFNRSWQLAQEEYTATVKLADTRHAHAVADLDPTLTGTTRKLTRTDLDDAHRQARSDAGAVRAQARARQDNAYHDLVAGLDAKFTTAGNALAAATMVTVPDSTVARFIGHGGCGARPIWLTPDGHIFPPRLHSEYALEAALPMLHQADTTADADQVSHYLKGWTAHPGPIDPEIAAILAHRGDDPYFAARVMQTIGAQGVRDAIGAAAQLTAHNPDEQAQVQALQDTTATIMAQLVASASRAPAGQGLPAGFAADLTGDARATAILFSYADRANLVFGGPFMHDVGQQLMRAEYVDPSIWRSNTGPPTAGYGTRFDSVAAHDPTLAFLRAAAGGVQSAQAALGDQDLLDYFLTTGPDYPGRGSATADLLRVATIDHARDPIPPGTDPTDSTAWHAADIASNALHDAAGRTPLPGTRVVLAGILATYLPDVDYSMRATSSGGPGVVDHQGGQSLPSDVVLADGWPRFGIQISLNDTRAVLANIGADGHARAVLAQATSRYTTIVLNNAADETQRERAGSPGYDLATSPFVVAAHNSAALRGLLVGGLADGNIAGATSEAERRRQVAALFALPVGYLPTDKLPAPPLVDYLLDQAKQSVIDSYVGDGVAQAVQSAGSDWDASRRILQLQALDAARSHGMLDQGDLQFWPRDPATGEPIPVAQLTATQADQILVKIGGHHGVAAVATAEIANSADNYRSPWTKS